MVAKPTTIAKLQADAAPALARVLADTYFLYLKTHNFHWNVQGANFPGLHRMFEEQYQALWISLDALAERIRALGQYAPGTYAKFKALAAVKETEEIPDGEAMLRALIADSETVVHDVQTGLTAAHTAGDEGTAALLSDRLVYHQKQIWMMKSTLAA